MKKTLCSVLISLVVLLLACKSDITPIDTGCVAPEAIKNIVGTWNCVAPITGNSRHQYSGTMSFNADGSLTDPDTLWGLSYGSIPVTKRLYTVSNSMLKLYFVTKEDTLLMEGKMDVNQCNKMIFSGWFNSSNADNFKLTLTR